MCLAVVLESVGKEAGTGPSVSLHPVPRELSGILLVPVRQSETLHPKHVWIPVSSQVGLL